MKKYFNLLVITVLLFPCVELGAQKNNVVPMRIVTQQRDLLASDSLVFGNEIHPYNLIYGSCRRSGQASLPDI